MMTVEYLFFIINKKFPYSLINLEKLNTSVQSINNLKSFKYLKYVFNVNITILDVLV